MREDYESSVTWYKKGAECGDVYAQYNLGLCYLSGDGIRRNERIAINWFKKAAAQGYNKALNKLFDLGISGDWS